MTDQRRSDHASLFAIGAIALAGGALIATIVIAIRSGDDAAATTSTDSGAVVVDLDDGAVADPDVDPELFRHHGVKPVQKEVAIVMISDATEAAARAYSRTEDPTASGLKNVVETVVAEKVDDGQLDESQLTFGDLTRVKAELVRALMGYYHARVPYPGFPGPKVAASVEGVIAAALPASAAGTPTVEPFDEAEVEDEGDR